jgi:hypothetical protein
MSVVQIAVSNQPTSFIGPRVEPRGSIVATSHASSQVFAITASGASVSIADCEV